MFPWDDPAIMDLPLQMRNKLDLEVFKAEYIKGLVKLQSKNKSIFQINKILNSKIPWFEVKFHLKRKEKQLAGLQKDLEDLERKMQSRKRHTKNMITRF